MKVFIALFALLGLAFAQNYQTTCHNSNPGGKAAYVVLNLTLGATS